MEATHITEEALERARSTIFTFRDKVDVSDDFIRELFHLSRNTFDKLIRCRTDFDRQECYDLIRVSINKPGVWGNYIWGDNHY